MKLLLASFVSTYILLLMSCQDSSITEPQSNLSFDKTTHSDTIHQQGVLSIQYTVTDPRPILNSLFLIDGQVEYEYWLIKDNDFNEVSVDLYMCANLINFCSTCPVPQYENQDGYIDCGSCDLINYSGNSLIMQKRFPVTCESSLVLVCELLINSTEIRVESLWLEISNNQAVGNYDE